MTAHPGVPAFATGARHRARLPACQRQLKLVCALDVTVFIC